MVVVVSKNGSKKWLFCVFSSIMVFLGQYARALNQYCDAHVDASCLPSDYVLLSQCKSDSDCFYSTSLLDPDSGVKFKCQARKCKPTLDCPIGFFSWKNGCLPYSVHNEQCPGGSEQCIQGLVCIDGVCMGPCADGEILADNVCLKHSELKCIDQDCEYLGCPANYPVCTYKESTDSHHCCKKKERKTPRANRHVDGEAQTLKWPEMDSAAVYNNYNAKNKKNVQNTAYKSFNLVKPRRRMLPQPTAAVKQTASSLVQRPPATRAISPVYTAAGLRYLSSSCISYAEVQIGSTCYARVQVGQPCTFSAQCPSRTATTGQPPYLCINGICQLSIVCSAGYFSFNSACLKYSASGQSCVATTTQCLSGSSCINGECFSGCAYNQLLIENVCIGYADYGCILRSCESDGCPSNYPVCNYVRSQNAYLCCNEVIRSGLLCPNTNVQPQLSFGTNVPIDCVARQCGQGYLCTHVLNSGGSRYICCPRSSALYLNSTLYTTPSPLDGYLSVCVKNSIRAGCTPISSELCFCSRRQSTLYEPTLATFTTALPTITTTSTTTTTTAATTTTTTAATTTCQLCTFDDVTLTNGTLIGETVMVPAGIQVIAGCNQMTVVCDASAFPDATVFMEFNGFLGGPTTGNTAVVSATLMCNGAGDWTYTALGVTTVINDVACYSNATGTPTTGCASCTPASVQLIPGTLVGEIPTTPGVVVVDGCQTLTVTCDSSSVNGAYVYMGFNNFVGGPTTNFEATVSATLLCEDGDWKYVLGADQDPIVDVECIQGSNLRSLRRRIEMG